MGSQIVLRAINTHSPFVGLREFLPQPICATCHFEPRSQGPPGLASTSSTNGGCAGQVLVREQAEEQVLQPDRWEGTGEIKPSIR